MKKCSTCKIEKSLDEFHRSKSAKDSHIGICKNCIKIVTKKRYDENRESIIATATKWNIENKERKKENWNRWYAKNREKLIADRIATYFNDIERERAVKLVWREKNRRHCSDKSLQYYKNKPWMAVKQVNKRRAAKLRATPSWANLDAISEIYKKCHEIQIETGVKHNVDHCVPLLSNKVCGLHCEANLQILTFSDNAKKHNTHWPDMWS